MFDSDNLKASLQTRFHIEHQPLFGVKDSFYFLGSCFSDEIAGRLKRHGISCHLSEFGTLFNPLSISKAIEVIQDPSQSNIVSYESTFHALDFSHRFKHSDKAVLENTVSKCAKKDLEHIKRSKYLFITLGTSWYYELDKQVVGNCHKLPQIRFEKNLATVDQVKKSLGDVYKQLIRINPHSKVFFTLSPVRHLRDGIIENSQSKAILQAAITEFTQQFNEVGYFPSYEIVTQELVDHRFYKNDLMHPSDWTIHYVFTRFIETFGTHQFKEYMVESEKLLRNIEHRVLDDQSQASWDERLDSELTKFSNKWGINLSREVAP